MVYLHHVMLFLYLFPLLLIATKSYSAGVQQYLRLDFDNTQPFITSELSEYVKRIIKEERVHGISLGIARAYGTSELGAWGRSDENGRPSVSEVRSLSSTW